MRIEWSPKETKDLHTIYRRISEDNQDAAVRAISSIIEQTARLSLFPRLGHTGFKQGTRELVLSPLPYIAVYRVRDSYLQIARIWHGAQRR